MMATVPTTLAQLRRHAIARTLFAPTGLAEAVTRLGFVQADPLRAPARAQDLTLRHRVAEYRAGDLERAYPSLEIEEDFFVNYGFLPRAHQTLMHPRVARQRWSKTRWAKADAVLDFVRSRGPVHPDQVDAHFNHGSARNWFGGSSRVSTELLDGLHYRGLLRVARREGGTRVYAWREPWPAAGDAAACRARLDALVDLALALYAPLPAVSLRQLVYFLRGAAPQWDHDRERALQDATRRHARARIDGLDWLWPAGEDPAAAADAQADTVRALAPFDPLVWDRRRFELFWDWPYRFEAYTPAAKRRLGHYALPLLWRERVVGWANVAVRERRMQVEVGFVGRSLRDDAAFVAAMDDELHRMHRFLGLDDDGRTAIAGG